MALRGRRFQVQAMISSLPLQFTFGEVSAQCSPRHMIRFSTASEGHRTCRSCNVGGYQGETIIARDQK